MKTRIALLTGIAAGVLVPSTAFAQDAGGQDVTVSAEAEPAASAANVPENVIIITARRRAEASQDVPLAIATLDARTINDTGAFSVQRIQQLAPSLQV
jgi:iron complex outermembrane receptor protein